MESMNLMFLIFAFLFFISIVATRLSAHLGMPLLLVFLGVGMLAGEEGIGGIQFSNFLAANMVGQLALAIILTAACAPAPPVSAYRSSRRWCLPVGAFWQRYWFWALSPPISLT